jgi:hypothetical protein
VVDATVTLNTRDKRPVTVDPDTINVNATGGTVVIRWRPAGGSTFTFVAVTFKEANPFQSVVVTDDEITARDVTRGPEAHQYIILVKAGGKYYSSEDGMAAGASGPTIRNN